MGILFQALLVLILVTAGLGGILNNFTLQKRSSLSQLESTDKTQLNNAISKFLAAPETCRFVFSGQNLNSLVPASLPLAINTQIQGVGQVTVFEPGSLVGSLEITEINLNVNNCGASGPTASLCGPTGGLPTHTHEGMISWIGRTLTGTSREVRGQVGPVLFTPNGTNGVSTCAYAALGGSGGTSPSGSSLDCTVYGLTNNPTPGGDCLGFMSLVEAKMGLGSMDPGLGTEAKFSWWSTRGLSRRSPSQGFAANFIRIANSGTQPSHYVFDSIQISSPPSCRVGLGSETCYAGPSPSTSPLISNQGNCPSGTQMYEVYDLLSLVARRCLDPLVALGTLTADYLGTGTLQSCATLPNDPERPLWWSAGSTAGSPTAPSPSQPINSCPEAGEALPP